MKLNKKILFSYLLLVIIFLPISVFAQSTACNFIKQLRDSLLLIGGTVAIIGWIIAGLLYLTSGGSPEKTGIAKKAMIAAIIGTALLVVAQSAFSIVNSLIGGPNIPGCT
jgi:hypothetical protein